MADHHDTTGTGHPLASVVGAAREGFTCLAEQPAWSLDGDQTRDLLVEVTALAAQITELRARLLAHGEITEATTSQVGATSTAAWLAAATRTTRSDARAATRLAGDLGAHEATRRALASGAVLADQAAVIIAAVEALPEEVAVREQCEEHLVALAAVHDAVELRILGRRVLAVVDPEAAEAHEAKLLDEEERAAARRTRFSMRDNGDGTHTGAFTIPDLYADMLRKILMGFAAPKHVRATGEVYDHSRPTPERMGRAFCDFVSSYPAESVPHAGGVSATVVVTMDLATLLGSDRVAFLDTGTPITASSARMLACGAGVIPAVLGGRSQVLDLGRKRRFHHEAQRLVLALTQKHCQRPGCTVPAWLCHVHHRRPWSQGGSTNIEDAELLCPRHHTQAHREPPDPPLRT